MKKTFALALGLLAACAFAAAARAQALSPEEKTFLDKHTADVVTVTPKKLADGAVGKAFGSPIYELTVTIKDGDGGTSGQSQIAARVDDKLVPVSRPGSDGDCPAILKMVNPAFSLKSDDDAKTFQTALDVLYPIFGDDDKKAVAFRHNGNQWTFVRGKFFDSLMGFVITTDAGGKITGIKYVLKLP